MRVSAVVATRDRPVLLRRALRSAAAQTHTDVEIILVDDGSSEAAVAEHADLVHAMGPRASLHVLPQVPGGHGPSFARNHGAARATGTLLAFLDDDDEWIDPDYLARAARLCEQADAELLYANQEAMRADGSRIEGVVWIEDLAAIAGAAAQRRPDGTFLVTPATLLRSRGFGHLNATIVRRALFEQLGGFDILLRYEEDRDFHLRAIDAATTILHDPAIVARHHVPLRDSASTRVGPDGRSLDQLRVLDKAMLYGKRPEIRAYARRYKAFTLKTLAQRRAAAGDYEVARFYANQALAIGLNPKWLAYAAWLALRR